MESYVLRVATVDDRATGSARLRGEIQLVRSGQTQVFTSAEGLVAAIVEDLAKSAEAAQQ